LPELKNTSKGKPASLTSFAKGLQLEHQALGYLQKNFQARLLRHRYQSPFGEVDLLLRLPTGELLMIEVKSLSNDDHIAGRLSGRQKQRLRRAFQWLSESHFPVLFWLIFVETNGTVTIMDDVL
jgi:Holliday junction resolvase-like predicted endonuclease